VSQRDAGLGVLFFSEDLDELLQISDRIAVLFEGKIMGVFDTNTVTIDRLGMLMAGMTEGASA